MDSITLLFQTESALYGMLGLFLGFGGLFILHNLALRGEIQDAQKNAKEWLEQAEDEAADMQKAATERAEEYAALLEEQNEDELAELAQKVETLKSLTEDKAQRLENNYRGQTSLLDKKNHILRENENRLAAVRARYEQLKNDLQALRKKYRLILEPLAAVSSEELKQELKESLYLRTREDANKQAQILEQEVQLNLERDAKRFLNLALNRFARPYCAERGIGNVEFPNPDVMQRTIGTDRVHLNELEKAVGVDITLNTEHLQATVLGFDPVRRELGRAALEKLMHEKNLNEKRIQDIVAKTKKDLFKKIRRDGEAIARELQLKNLDPEIQNMMGSLRYRYSFAQNQYFHCAEVGWLCGLLATEFGEDTLKGRRVGMLHDIGKAMDHSKDGGHAVIGADFIERHNEAPDVVHAVRAHHYDETPSTILAYLTIAADAISGARPGARRSTMDSYFQKMQNLEKIGKSFPGVTDTYILSAGREMRVAVNAQEVDDQGALKLSQQIAQKIEEEMSYPGLIRVIVVRETQAVEFAR